MTNRAANDGVGDTTSFVVQPRCSASTIHSSPLSPSSSMRTTMMTTTGSRRPCCQRPPQPSLTSSSSSSVSSTDADCGEEVGQRNCPAAGGGCSAHITRWAAGHMASSGRHCASPPRQRRRPLALEDQLVLCHGFGPADSPASLPVTTTKTTTASGLKSKQRDAPAAGGRQHNYQQSLDGGR